MTIKELTKKIEELVEQLATTTSYSNGKQPVQQLEEDLLGAAWEILEEKLNEKLAYRLADRVLAHARKELKQRKATAEGAAAAAASPATNT